MVHILALAAPFFFTWKALVTCVVLVLAHRQHRRLHGLSPLLDARQLFHLSADPLAAGLVRRTVGRRLGPDLGGQPSQASRLTATKKAIRTARATAAGGATCCGSCPTSAASALRELLQALRPGHAQGPGDAVLALLVPALALHPGGVLFADRLFRLGTGPSTAWSAGRWSSGACSCGWSTCCTSPGSSTRPRTCGAIATTKPPTTAATCGGSASWPSAKAGTTTTTPISAWPARATVVGNRHHLLVRSAAGKARPGLERRCKEVPQSDSHGLSLGPAAFVARSPNRDRDTPRCAVRGSHGSVARFAVAGSCRSLHRMGRLSVTLGFCKPGNVEESS